MNDLAHSLRLANPKALMGVVSARDGSSRVRAGRVKDCPELASLLPAGWGGWDVITVIKHAAGGRDLQMPRSMTARNGHRLGETGPSTRELCRCRFCSLRSFGLLQK